jgi:hypothetical protein
MEITLIPRVKRFVSDTFSDRQKVHPRRFILDFADAINQSNVCDSDELWRQVIDKLDPWKNNWNVVTVAEYLTQGIRVMNRLSSFQSASAFERAAAGRLGRQFGFRKW